MTYEEMYRYYNTNINEAWDTIAHYAQSANDTTLKGKCRPILCRSYRPRHRLKHTREGHIEYYGTHPRATAN